MDKNTIKSFYLSLIDNPDAKWTAHKDKDMDGEYVLYNCEINQIKIKGYKDYQLSFTYTGSNHWGSSSDVVTFSDIGISKFHLMFPYFGIISRIDRRIKREKKNINKRINTKKIDSIANVLSKDKALVRDTKIDEILK